MTTTGNRRSIAEAFARSIREGRIGHAYLLRGPEGTGKHRFALDLVAAMECERADGTACRACASCVAIREGRHPDLFDVGIPEGKTTIGIEPVRDLIEQLSRRAWNGRGRRAILDPADRMGQEAANCLLRPLEEPPPGALFLLVTSRPEAILPTIRSRATEVFFGPLSPAELERDLVGAGVEPGRAAPISELAEGNLRRARALASGEAAPLREAFLRAVLERPGSLSTAQELLEAIRKGASDETTVRGRLDSLAAELLTLARLGLSVLWTGHAPPVLPGDAPRLEAMAALGARRLGALVERTVSFRDRLVQSAQAALALENYLCEVARLDMEG